MSSINSIAGGERGIAALEQLPLLQSLAPELRQLVVDSFVPMSFPFGSLIVREGDEADGFYVLAAGTARVIKSGEHGEEVPLKTLGPGDSFGEMSLLGKTTRMATVRASGQVAALRLDRSVFLALAARHPEFRAPLERLAKGHDLRDFLRLRTPFGALSSAALVELIEALEPRSVRSGEASVRQGEAGDAMFVIREGRFRVVRNDGQDAVTVAFLRTGDLFGEASLLDGEARKATVEAVSDAVVLSLGVDDFQRLARHPEFGKVIAERAALNAYHGRARVPLDFAEELLPAEARAPAPPAVGLEFVDVGADGPGVESAEVDTGDLKPFVGPRRRIRRFPYILQVDELDCGAASLAIICRYFGRRVSLTRIREAAGTGLEGTSLLGIARGGERLGLLVRSVKASKSRLDDMALPAIVHWEGRHWMVLYEVGPRQVRVSDPASGLRSLPRADFEEKWSGYAALFEPTSAFDDVPEEASRVGWLLSYMSPYRRPLALALALAFVAAASVMVVPVLTKLVVDSVVSDHDVGLLTLIALGMAVALVATSGATILQRYFLARVAVRFDSDSVNYISTRLLDLPLAYFNARRTGDIARRLEGLRQVRQFFVEQGVLAVTSATQVLVAVAIMFATSWFLAVVYLATLPVYVAVMRFFSKRLRPVYDTLEESFGRYQSKQIDAIKGIETIKAMGAEPSLARLLVGQFDQLSGQIFRSDWAAMLYEAAIQMIAFLSLALFLWIGALQVVHGHLTIGGLVSFNTLVLLANGPVVVILLLWDKLQYNSVVLARLNDILEPEPEQGADHSHLAPVPTLEGRISFDRVGFHWGGMRETPILEEITFDVAAGSTVAIVGRSGSGKTTLMKCLAGLLVPTSGTIRFDGVDLRTLDYRQLRRHIGFVLQENHLFFDTIAANIAFGDEEPDMAQVIRAARMAAAHDFIVRLPLGYDTRIGEGGLMLSGGQRQRVAIARALYTNPAVLILDEATSALDTESERAVQESMELQMEGRTSFVIAHRLSTVRHADLIVVLDKGRVVECGTHDELIAREGVYYLLSSQQLNV